MQLDSLDPAVLVARYVCEGGAVMIEQSNVGVSGATDLAAAHTLPADYVSLRLPGRAPGLGVAWVAVRPASR